MDAANSWASASSNPSLKNNSWDAKPPSIWGDSKVQSDASKWGVENCDNWNRGKESGWGAVSPVPNAGTEAWGSTQGETKQQHQQQHQTQVNGPKEMSGNKPAWGVPPPPAPTGAWSRGNPMIATSQPPAQTPPVAPSSWAEAVSSKGSSNPPSITGAASDDGTKSHEEMISSAINSMDNWGKTVIRQDTAWVIDEPQADGTTKTDAQPEEQISLSNKHLINGTAIWENQKNKPSDRPTCANGPTTQPAFQAPKPTWPPTPTIPSNVTPWNTQPQVSQENAWEKKEEERTAWDQSGKSDVSWDKIQTNNNWEEKTPSLSEASTWTDDKLAVSTSSGNIDDGTSVWGDPINQGWRTGKAQHHDIEASKLISPINNQTANAWNSIPSQLKSDVSWSNDLLSNKIKSSSTGSWNDINELLSNNRPVGDNGLIKNQHTQRSVLLQKLLSIGFKMEEAQAILISNNMNLENNMSELFSMKRDEMLTKSAGASSANASSVAAANLLSSSLHNSLLTDSIPPRTNAPPLLPPPQLNMPPPPLTNLGNQVLGNLGNQGIGNLGNQSMGLSNTGIGNPVLTQQQMLQLSQEIQLVVQSGLLPANALNQTTLTNPAFIHALQQLIGHHTLHQKLLIQSVQPGLTQLQQQKLIEVMTAEQKVITATKSQLLQLALNSHIQVPNNIHPPTLHTPTLPGSSLHGSGLHAGLGDGVASSSRLISQWKVSSDLETKKIDSNVWLPTTTNNNTTWPDIISNTNTMTSTSFDGAGSGTAVGEDGVALEIEEFIPGKPWVGPNQKNVEDDPFITPGSVPRNSLSTVNDIQVMNILGKKKKVPTATLR